ncbi:Pycsar system effector family protein [Sphingomonas alba]|uniref:DUF5706 domain-containing protein n=1 Tax=Sphingomonas alba TaxID=2908208 RepID=A0ABT0RPS3_9SPHN|nr:Pycsar system effector family protein [Sphingomonas alba]MCL6684656.1 DUF5706 domain-containing protein [Sphingomonas alba]
MAKEPTPTATPLTTDERRMLGLGNPDYEFPKEVHNLVIAAYEGNWNLSEMADNKASILMGASFVVFSLSIGDVATGKASFPLLVLTLFSFAATVLGVLTVRPNRLRKFKLDPNNVNIMFFGSYANISREEYVEQMMKVLTSEEEVYKRLARDVYDHGCILRADKYRWLYWSYTLFLVGLVITFGALVLKLVMELNATAVLNTIQPLP